MIDRPMAERLLWALCSIPELHELSYEMGKLGDEACPAGQVRMFRRGQEIMAEITGLVVEMERELAAMDTDVLKLASVP